MNKIAMKALQRYTIECGRWMTICMSDQELTTAIAQLDPAENPNGYGAEDVVKYIREVRSAAAQLASPVDEVSGLEVLLHVLAKRAPDLGAEWTVDTEYESEENPPHMAVCIAATVITLEV